MIKNYFLPGKLIAAVSFDFFDIFLTTTSFVATKTIYAPGQFILPRQGGLFYWFPCPPSAPGLPWASLTRKTVAAGLRATLAHLE
jgi:hypothetical protein